MERPASVLAHYADLQDPRVKRTRRHEVSNIIVIPIGAIIAGAERWADGELFGESKTEWVATLLALPNRIPSQHTFNCVFAALNPNAFCEQWTAWMRAVVGPLPAHVIAIDDKTVRGSHDRFLDQPAIHLVSGWATTNRPV